MEARQIRIISSRTQQEKVITSSAETLGELKADLREAGIDYNGLGFFEGVSRTELKDDAAQLPKDLSWKGKRTNNLVFMLTEPQKKIRNGAEVTDRASAYAYIKDNNLQKEVEKKFGQNFTRCKTPDLIDFCNKQAKKSAKPAAKPAAKTAKAAPKTKVSKVSAVEAPKPAAKRGRPAKVKTVEPAPAEQPVEQATPVAEAPAAPANNGSYIGHEELIDLLIAKKVITAEEATTGQAEQPEDVNFSKADIDDMFKDVRH